MNGKEHWETIYTTKATPEVSWYETDPKVSLDLTLARLHSTVR